MNNVAIPARLGSWLAGQNQYAIFQEPEATQVEMDGKAHFLVSIGETVGFADYTCFIATDKYLRENTEVVQNWTNAIYQGAEMDSVRAERGARQGRRTVLSWR